MKDVKQPATYDQQIAKLKSHGCIVKDDGSCKYKLSQVSYYRLSAYFLPFRDEKGAYVPNTHFDTIYNIYEFDRKLRTLLFSAIEIIEVYLRTSLSYYHAFRFGSIGYLSEDNFNDKHDTQKFKDTMNREIKNNENSLFVQHHIKQYGGVFPIWAIAELFTFGTLSYFYNDMLTYDQKRFADVFFGANYETLKSWLRCCTDLRNICAHYGRLYYRIFSAIPRGLGLKEAQKRRLWGAILVIKNLYPDPQKWHAEFLPQLFALFDQYEKDINLYHLAFPKDWKEQLSVKSCFGADIE